MPAGIPNDLTSAKLEVRKLGYVQAGKPLAARRNVES